MRQLTVEEAKAVGIPVPDGAIGVNLSWESVFPEPLTVIRWGEKAPRDIAKGERIMIVFDTPSKGIQSLVEAVSAVESALEECEYCTCYEHVEGLRVATRQLLDAAGGILKGGRR